MLHTPWPQLIISLVVSLLGIFIIWRKWKALYAIPPSSPEERAEETLLHFLNHKQREAWTRHRKFRVRGSRTNAIYEIDGSGGRAWCLVRDLNKSIRYCAYTLDSVEWGIDYALGIRAPQTVPKADDALAKYLLISTNEPGFVHLANVVGS